MTIQKLTDIDKDGVMPRKEITCHIHKKSNSACPYCMDDTYAHKIIDENSKLGVEWNIEELAKSICEGQSNRNELWKWDDQPEYAKKRYRHVAKYISQSPNILKLVKGA